MDQNIYYMYVWSTCPPRFWRLGATEAIAPAKGRAWVRSPQRARFLSTLEPLQATTKVNLTLCNTPCYELPNNGH
jgi:hypothetical protein